MERTACELPVAVPSPAVTTRWRRRLDIWGTAVPAALLAAMLGAWEGATHLFRIAPWLLPPPSAILGELFASRVLLVHHTWVTLQEVIVGFLAAFVTGVVLAVLIASSRTLERTFYPIIIASQTVPIIAIAPLLLIWFGYGLLPKVIVVALISFFPIVVNTVDGLSGVDPALVNLLRSMGATRRQIFLKARLPASLPSLFSGTKIAIAVSVIGAVIGEWVGASEGLGYLMTRASAQFLTARVFAAILILSVLGVGLFLAVSLLERLLLPWHAQGQASQKTKEEVR